VALVQTQGSRQASTWRVERYGVVGSTNQMVAERARRGEPEGLVVVADHQESGRGRLGRSWSDEGLVALLASVLLEVAEHPSEGFWLAVAVGLSALGTCEELGARGISLKWPNDLVAGEKKLAGILSELVTRTPEPGRRPGAVDGNVGSMALVVGIGLNLAWQENLVWQERPRKERVLGGDPLAKPVTLQELRAPSSPTGPTPLVDDRDAFLAKWLSRLSDLYPLCWEEAGRKELRKRYEARCSTLGSLVRVELAQGSVLYGKARAITEDGALLVSESGSAGGDRGGRLVAVRAGDVVHVRSVKGADCAAEATGRSSGGNDPANLMQS